MKKILYSTFLIMVLLLSSCSSTVDFPKNTEEPDTEQIETEQQEERFNTYASEKYNCIDCTSFYDGVDEQKYSSEILKKYKDVIISQFGYVFDDIIIDENNKYVGIGDNGNDYYNIPDNLYDKLIQNTSSNVGIIYKLSKIVPNTKIDFFDMDIDSEYNYMSVEPNYTVNRLYYYDIIDIYTE